MCQSEFFLRRPANADAARVAMVAIARDLPSVAQIAKARTAAPRISHPSTYTPACGNISLRQHLRASRDEFARPPARVTRGVPTTFEKKLLRSHEILQRQLSHLAPHRIADLSRASGCRPDVRAVDFLPQFAFSDASHRPSWGSPRIAELGLEHSADSSRGDAVRARILRMHRSIDEWQPVRLAAGSVAAIDVAIANRGNRSRN